MKHFIILLLLVFSLKSISQSTNFESLVSASTLQKHLNIIASAEMEGRETGTPGQRRAAAYIEQQFKQIGLASPATLKGYQQFYPLLKDSLLKADLEIAGYKAKVGEDFIISLGNNESVKLKSNSLAFAGYGIDDLNYNDYKNDVRNRIVVIFSTIGAQ